MATINVSAPSSFATLMISTATTFSSGSAVTVPALQDVTVNNNNGSFRWKQLDLTSQKVVATPSTNSVAFNIVLDPATFYGTVGSTGTSAAQLGLFELSNQKTPLSFRLYWAGTSTGATYVEGNGFIVGLAPKVNPDQPVWISPLTIEVDGNFTSGKV
jgi:hypothetical protein